MPFIKTMTSVKIDKEAEATLIKKLGKAIEVIPGKTEQWLMLDFADSQRLAFRGDNTKSYAMVEVSLLGRAEGRYLELLTSEICDALYEVLGIPTDGIYVSYSQLEHWGYDKNNF